MAPMRKTPHTRILVVDDDEAIREYVRISLETAGFSVITAPDGASGWTVFLANRADISLLLTDIEMPGIDGLRLAERVLDCDRELPVLFMSGGAVAHDRGHGFIPKPFKVMELLSRVHAVLTASKVRGLITYEQTPSPGIA